MQEHVRDASMGLRQSIDWVRRHKKELSLFNVDSTDPIPDTLRSYFETQNVEITVRRTASRAPRDIAVLSDATGVLALVDVATLRELTDTDHADPDGLGIADAPYEPILRHLKETTFTSYDTEQLLYASREIEDRARRVGQGAIHAGFQRCSIIAGQRGVYTDLARRGLSVHAYGVPDTTPPELGTGTVHPVKRDEIATTWFVIFDGGGNDSQRTALIAEQQDDNDFYGTWTYDPGLVDSLLTHLEQTYGSPSENDTTPP